MKQLKYALYFNSIFSLSTGILLTIYSEAIAALFGQSQQLPFTVLGASLIIFAFIVYIIGRQNPVKPLPALVIIILDLMWVIISAAILAAVPFGFSSTGNLILATVALMVLVIAVLQTIGLAKLDVNPETGFKELRFSRNIKANPAMTWEIISDVANYHHVAPNIDNVNIVSGTGEGLVRQCSQGDGSWTEDCVLWKEGEKFSFKVNTNAPDYPFPLSYLQGTWKVTPSNREHSNIEMKFEFQYNRKILNVILHPMMAPKFRSIVKELLDNWENKLSNQH